MMTDIASQTFLRFCETVQEIAESRGSLKKTQLFANYLKSLNKADDIDRAIRFAGEGAFSSVSGKRASIGARTVALCAAEFCEINYDIVFKACRTATGSASETIEKLMNNIPVAKSRRSPSALSLAQVEQLYIELEKERKRDTKQHLLIKAWEQMTPLEIKYFIRVMGQGSLRIGFEAKSIVNAAAKAFDQDPEDVRYAHMITGSLGEAATLAYMNRLHTATFTLFQPVAFMLASPIESRAIEDITHYIAEEKFDGMRCQLHAGADKVTLYSRDLNEITHSFPEVVDFFTPKKLPGIVLDGELCVFSDNTIKPFQLLQKRMGVKKPSKKMLEEFPVVFISYDILFADDKPLFGKTLVERRDILQEICKQYGIMRSRQFEVTSNEQVEDMFERAIAHGNEGLMLKHKDSTYEYGQRRKSWLKVKKPSGSIDTVIMYAHAGSGKRGGTYSDFTLGVSVKGDDRYEEEFIPIGKAYGGYTDEELKRLNKEMKKLIVDRFGPTYSLKPGLVVELEFDDIQVNKRTKAGYTLRFPRFKAIRWDLSPSDADTLMDVERMYNQKLHEERKPQSQHQSFIGN
ncbi:MAG: ATP-dependent DNA ligase [Balneolia bacterium]|nr:ATP-dependent DNA ligase [Balneolia bacterium]